MPGLKQLKQFSEDVLNIGNEINLRASRGEKPPIIKMPPDIPEESDADEFANGLPKETANEASSSAYSVPSDAEKSETEKIEKPVTEADSSDKKEGADALSSGEELFNSDLDFDLDSSFLNDEESSTQGTDTQATDAKKDEADDTTPPVANGTTESTENKDTLEMQLDKTEESNDIDTSVSDNEAMNLDLDSMPSEDTKNDNPPDTDLEKENLKDSIAPSTENDKTEEDAIDDFDIPEVDDEISDESDFDIGSPDDFDISGFSDTEEELIEKKLTAPDADHHRTGLTNEEYKTFRKNLLTYPLNVRIAVGELIVKNEFTDDIIFEVIDKVIKKVSARHLASHLSKILDVNIDVPRDYERRSFAEYQAYKSSLRYQLYNKIIPVALIALAACMVGICVFYVVNQFVYRPLKANSLYKQGYEMLEADSYPQSEIKFSEALSYHPNKKWFFKYARGYCAHKQYNRAEDMYIKILSYFNYDKEAGLEYAKMEMDELANYERAETILKRFVLDHYINDKDGMLLLGDVYLEWATEKEPDKFDDARVQYASLMDLYGATDLYLSRMLRYFIRTDNLKKVIQLKEHFSNKPKSLDSQSLIDLSGYLLDKEYGELAASDEYLRYSIEGVRPLLERALKSDASNPVALYNMSRYFVETNDETKALAYLKQTLEAFDNAQTVSRKDIYKRINSYRLLGEMYCGEREYVKAEETYSKGINIFQAAKVSNDFKGNEDIGKLYADMGDIAYFISGNMEDALRNYTNAISVGDDRASLHYRVGVIHYSKADYGDALDSFIKATETVHNDNHLLIAMGNVLSKRDDNYAAAGYYMKLLDNVAVYRNRYGILLPHERSEEADIVNLYMQSANNLGVTQYRIARQTGDSSANAKAIVNLSESLLAWDVLTRNPVTMVRLEGGNLAEQNIKYITHPQPDYEPAIYGDIPRTLTGEQGLRQ